MVQWNTAEVCAARLVVMTVYGSAGQGQLPEVLVAEIPLSAFEIS